MTERKTHHDDEPAPNRFPDVPEQMQEGKSPETVAEMDRQTHLIDPRTHPSSGDPPPALTPEGERLGVIPVTRNANADAEQARQEGLDAARQHAPTKAEKASKRTTKTKPPGSTHAAKR